MSYRNNLVWQKKDGQTNVYMYIWMYGWMNHDETVKLALRENKDTVIRVKHESVYIPELNEIKKKVHLKLDTINIQTWYI